MNEFVIFFICGLVVLITSLITIWAQGDTQDQIVADYWWWQLPM
jgi:hypothetical protein